MRHTRTGWWLEEAGEVTPQPPLSGDTRADVVVVGGGYLGLWTAWQLRQLEPELDVLVLEAALCGHGPSGRNGGFCETLWGDAPTLREKAGDAAALAVCRASEEAVRGIGAWCETNEVDAWFREAPMLRVATTESQVGSWERDGRAAAALGAPDEVVAVSAEDVRKRCDSPLFLGGELYRLNATVHPARLALGLRTKLLEHGVRIHERTEVTKLDRSGSVETRTGRVEAGAAVLAVNTAAAGFPGYRLSLAVASEPHRAHRADPGRARRARLDGRRGDRRQPHARPLHAHDARRADRVRMGRRDDGARRPEGGSTGARPRRRGIDAREPDAILPQTRGREVTHAWGGPIDVSPTHLPIFGSRGRVHHGFGFTGNGVGPSYLGGEILARLALDRRDERTQLAIVEPDRKLFPPEPFRYAGGSLIRRALVAKDAAEDEGREPSLPTRVVTSLPRRLGLRLPR